MDRIIIFSEDATVVPLRQSLFHERLTYKTSFLSQKPFFDPGDSILSGQNTQYTATLAPNYGFISWSLKLYMIQVYLKRALCNKLLKS